MKKCGPYKGYPVDVGHIFPASLRSVGLAEWLGLPILDHEVTGLRLISAQDCTVFICTEPFIITLPSSQYDLNNVERDVKHESSSSGQFEMSRRPKYPNL